MASPELQRLADCFRWVPIARVGRWIKWSRKFGAERLILAGGVRKTDAFTPWRILQYLPDWRTLRIWYRRARKDRRNLAILQALADELHEAGITVENSVKYCPEALAEEGQLTANSPAAAARSDIEFAWPIALKIARMDIGQAIAVREKDIVAVEAIEGTDAMIERAGRLARSGWTLIKVAQANQDMRFDVPTIGPQTIEKLHEAKAAAVVVEAGKTLIIEKDKTLRLAERYGIAVLGRQARGEQEQRED
ncbi:MAG: LpxI family protein [Phycisphaerae bacterium]|nr:LpxI family protein [Phycisphaerae bacterium]